MDDEFSDYEESDAEESQQRIDDLESRIDELEVSHGWANAATSGYGLGSLLAAILSWDQSHAVGWVLVHSLLSWFYVIYRLIVDWDHLKLF
jgi:hypothetical protein